MFNRKEWMKQWRKDNSEHIKKYNKQYKKDNSEHLKKCQKKWGKDNSKHLKEYRKQQYLKNREKELKQAKLWKKNNPEKIKAINNRFYQKHPEKRKEYRKILKAKVQYVQDYKISKGCSICGYNKNPRLLGFHHPDNNKEFNVSEIVTRDRSLEKIKKEMDKCILLCNICHPKLHWKLRKKKENS